MTDREETLGRALSALLEEQTDALLIDTDAAARRLERELSHASNRRRQLLGVTAAAAALLAAFLGGMLLTGNQADPPAPTPAVDRVSPTAGEPYYLDLSTGRRSALPSTLASVVPESRLAYSPDGVKVAYGCVLDSTACPSGGHGGQRIVVADADGTDPVVVRAVPRTAEAANLTWSPDGRLIAYQRSQRNEIGNLFQVDVESGRATQITDLPVSSALWYTDMRLDFSPDGRKIIYNAPRAVEQDAPWDLWTVSPDGGDTALVKRNAVIPRYLADGESTMYVTAGRSGVEGRVLSVRGPSGTRVLIDTRYWMTDLDISPDRSKVIPVWNGPVEVIDVTTSASIRLGPVGGSATWVDRDTVLVFPPRN